MYTLTRNFFSNLRSYQNNIVIVLWTYSTFWMVDNPVGVYNHGCIL